MAHPRPTAWRRPLLLLAEAVLAGSLAGHPRSAAAAAADAGGERAARLEAGDVSDDPGGEPLVLAVTLNGEDRGLVRLRLSQGGLWARGDALRAMGLAVRDGAAGDDAAALLPLSALAGLTVDYRAETQELYLNAPVELLAGGRAAINIAPGPRVAATTDVGAVLNYDLYASHGGGTAVSGLFDLRGFSGNRVLETTALMWWNSWDADRAVRTMRLDSALTLAWPERRMVLRLGDTVSGAAPWSRSTRIGGVQLATDLSLQPYLDTTPMALFTGSAALPSRAELYVDGVRRFAGELPVGPFAIGAGPARIDGAGQAQLVTTDILGRVSVQTFAIYETPRLLRPGLSDWSVELGALRQDYGLRAFGYGRVPVLSATLRHGASQWLTLEGHAEAARGLAHGGLGGAALIGQAGVLTASLSASRTGAQAAASAAAGAAPARPAPLPGTGVQYTLGYSYTRGGLNLAASVQRASPRFADLAALDGYGPPRVNDFLQLGWSSAKAGALGATLLRLRYRDEPARAYAGLTWSRSLDRGLTLRLSASQNLSDRRDRSLALALTLSPGRGWHASAGVQRQGGLTGFDLTADRPVPLSGGLGWRASAGRINGQGNAAGQLTWLGDGGELQLGASRFAGRNSLYAGYSGSLATLGGEVHAGRKVDDSFAVVTVDGVPDLPVLLENNVIGRTGAGGELLVRGLHANQYNRLAVDLSALPQEVMLLNDTVTAVPARRAGMRIAFPLRPHRAASLTVVDAATRPLAPGTPVRRGKAGAEDLVIGFDGQLYVEDPLPGERLTADNAAAGCTITLPADLPAGIAVLPAPLVCEAAP